MVDKLVIVESPAKANTIKKFLGGKSKVVASMGHIRDLPKSKLGIDIENNFEPQYINIRGKASLINSLKKDAKEAKKVYLATDPDREGEAIAWHLAYILGIDVNDLCRVTFNEITKTAVKNGIENPRKIDLNLTNAQQARRVLDRIVGYKISPVLWKKVKRGLSAGRVQSVAVKLIVDREEEIEKFIPEEYWNIYVDLKTNNDKKEFEDLKANGTVISTVLRNYNGLFKGKKAIIGNYDNFIANETRKMLMLFGVSVDIVTSGNDIYDMIKNGKKYWTSSNRLFTISAGK